MSDASDWVTVTREDGETVGYLEPLTDDYDVVQPRSLLGHCLGEPVEFVAGEELVEQQGLWELAEQWVLDADTDDEITGLTIVELSPRGVVLADYLATKGLMGTDSLHVRWPDTERRLRRQ
ncbi:serine/threonine protein phosphatase [Brachybacterium sp. GCM10030267]|uniref:serine/threonine protein phosphatase n=1 Tax=unclassified Brachybacterium TaxID=2623841 RepID=UPI0036075BE5